MSKKAFATVQKVFAAEVSAAFGFLASEFGLAGPDPQGVVLPVIAFVGPGLRYRVMLDPDDRAVMTRIEIDTDGTRLIADLDSVAAAAGLGAGNDIARSAHTVHSLRRSLQSQASYVRLLHPHTASGDATQLLRKAKARELRIR